MAPSALERSARTGSAPGALETRGVALERSARTGGAPGAIGAPWRGLPGEGAPSIPNLPNLNAVGVVARGAHLPP